MVRIRSIGVLSCAKVCAVVQGAVGAIVGIIPLLVATAGLAVAPFHQRMGIVGFAVAAVTLTLVYCVIGFLIGAFAAFMYNWAAQTMGGLEIELESIAVMPLAPLADSAPPA